MKQNRKWKIPHTGLERQTLCFSSYKNHKLKVKLWWVGARERKKRAFFVPFILSEGNFFNICVLSQCKVYWIHFQNIHTFTYQITLLHTIFCLFLKSLKAFIVSLSFLGTMESMKTAKLLLKKCKVIRLCFIRGVDTGCFWHWYADFGNTSFRMSKFNLILKLPANAIPVFWSYK